MYVLFYIILYYDVLYIVLCMYFFYSMKINIIKNPVFYLPSTDNKTIKNVHWVGGGGGGGGEA